MSDLQHQIWKIQFDGKPALSPGVENAKRVLDIGTGTGMWALDFGELQSLGAFLHDANTRHSRRPSRCRGRDEKQKHALP